MSNWTNRKDEEVELEIGEEIFEVKFIRITEFSHDANWGADADGHRGVPRTEIEEDYAEDITVRKEGEQDFVELKTLPQELQDKLKAELEAYIERNEPDTEQPEPDCDDLDD